MHYYYHQRNFQILLLYITLYAMNRYQRWFQHYNITQSSIGANGKKMLAIVRFAVTCLISVLLYSLYAGKLTARPLLVKNLGRYSDKIFTLQGDTREDCLDV